MTDNKMRLNRRRVLKASSLAGFSAMAINSSQASPTGSDSIQLVEIAVTNDITGIENQKHLDLQHLCRPKAHSITERGRKLTVDSELLPGTEIEKLKENSAIVYFDQFYQNSEVISPIISDDLAVIAEGRHSDPELAVRVTEDYELVDTRVEVDKSTGQASITSVNDGRSAGIENKIIQEGQSRELNLPIQEVEVPAEKTVGPLPDIHIQESIDPDEVDWRVETEEWMEEVKITPTISIRNYGKLEVEYREALEMTEMGKE